ncbi:MAG: tetratricopeptide repeat protein [Planctomycetes bacterium]|nr:tetratricopeptide repeat protein [Planctomycetota bacterium]
MRSESRLLFATAAATALGVAVSVAAAEGISWKTNYEEAVLASRASAKPLLVAFHVPGELESSRMETETYPDVQVAAFVEKNFVAVKVDESRRGDLAERFAVTGAPLVLLLDAAEELPVGRIAGYATPEEFLEQLQALQAAGARLRAGAEALKLNPEDVKAHVDVADALVRVGRPDEAGPHLERALSLDPGNRQGCGAQAHFALGSLAVQRKELEQAATHLHAAWDLDPEGKLPHAPELLYLLSTSQWQLGKREEAIATLEKLSSKYPESNFGRRAGIYLRKIRSGVPGRGEK